MSDSHLQHPPQSEVGSDRRRWPRPSRPHAARKMVVSRARLRRLGGLHGPGKFRHEHRGRARVSATNCCGCCCGRMPWPFWCSIWRRNWESRRAARFPKIAASEFSRPMTIVLWLAAEIAAMATDLAEFLGAALGFYLLIRNSHAAGRGGHRRVRDADSGHRAVRISVARARHHVFRGRHRRLLRHRNVSQQAGLAADCEACPAAGNSFRRPSIWPFRCWAPR